MLVLASTSPRRKEILQQLGVQFEQYTVDVDESAIPGESAEVLAQRLSKLKALAAVQELPGRTILAADTVVVSPDGQIFGKPEDQQQGISMLMQLSGRTHHVISGIAMSTASGMQVSLSQTRVMMRAFGEDEVRAYWETGEPLGKAGAYAIQGFGAGLIRKIEGSYTGVVGLPVEELMPLLKAAGISYWNH